MNSNVLGFLGLIRRAGKLTVGCDPVVSSMADGKSKLVIMAGDISNNTKSTIQKNAQRYSVHTVLSDCTKDELSFAVGKLAAVVSIDDPNFANSLKKKLTDVKEECQYDDKI